MKKKSRSGNVLADLGLPNSEQELLKAKLTVEIYRLIKARGLNQTDAARLLGTTREAALRLELVGDELRGLFRSCLLEV